MTRKRILLILAVILIVGAVTYLESMKARPGAVQGGPQTLGLTAPTAPPSINGENTASGSSTARLGALAAADQRAGYQSAFEIAGPTGFVNATSGFKLADLIGKKVVLLDFWTYSCINCIRTLPYLTSWYQKYQGEGLEIIGIHTPEFDFEKDIANVRSAVAQYGIAYPVILDGDYGTWNAYGNHYWPHEYLIDLAGYIVHDQVGEGNYNETEATIQALLAQRADVLGAAVPSKAAITMPNQPDIQAASPETYFGSVRNQYLGNGKIGIAGIQIFNEPTVVAQNALYLVGTWNIASQYAETPSSTGSGTTGADRIDYRYRAKGVYWVAGSAAGAPVDVEVLRDDEPIPQASAGSDIFYKNGRSYVRVTGNRLYRIIDDPAAANHFLKFIISSPGIQAYTFTFG